MNYSYVYKYRSDDNVKRWCVLRMCEREMDSCASNLVTKSGHLIIRYSRVDKMIYN